MWDSALQSDQLANGSSGQILGVPAPELSLLSVGIAWGSAHDTEHPPELLGMCICVFNVRMWQPDTGRDRNCQRSVRQAAIFYLFRVR